MLLGRGVMVEQRPLLCAASPILMLWLFVLELLSRPTLLLKPLMP